MNTANKVSWKVLKNPDFLKLWIGQIISYLGDRITQMALLGWLISSGQSTGTEMARITFFNMLPCFLFGHVAGALADRVSRKKLMMTTDVLRAALVFLIAVLISGRGSSPMLVYSIVFLAGICTAFFYPAKLAIIPNLVKPEELDAANALSAVTGMAATLLGTYFAGSLIQRLGFSAGFFINGITFILSALAILWIRYRPQAGAGNTDSFNVLTDFKKTADYLRGHRRAWNLILLATFLSFLSSFFYIALTVLAVDYFKLGTEGVGKLLTMLGTGMIAGSIAVVPLRKWLKAVDLLSICFLIIFFTTLTAEAVKSFTLAWIWLVFLGAANSIILVTTDTLLQRISPNRMRGKVFGFRSVLTNAVFLLSLLGVGEILKLASPFAVFKILSLVSLAVAVLVIVIEKDFAYQLIRSISRAVLNIFFSFEVEGEEYFRYQSKVIVAGNHTGFLDSPILIAASKRPIRFLVAQAVFSWPLVGGIVKRAGVIPVMKGKGGLALAEAVKTLQHGKAIGIFPEGALSKDGRMGKFHRGVAKLYADSKAPIIPFVIHGGFEAWHWGQLLPKPRKIILQFGQPIEDFTGTEEELVEELRQRIEFMKESLERRERAKAEQVYIESVLSLMQMKSDIYGSRTALSMKEKSGWNELSYIELSRQAKVLSDYLIEKGIQRGERIAILSESRPEWAVAFFAAIRTGAVFVPLDIKLTSTELVSILSNAEPRVLFISGDFAETAHALKTLLPSIETIILLNQNDSAQGIPLYSSLHASAPHEGRERDLDETALIIYTSGTTGSPKGVMTSFRSLIFEVKSFEDLMRLNSKDMFLSILPLNHLLELTGGFLGVLHAGGRICYSQSLHPQEIAKIMREKKITYMISVPLFLKVLKGSIEKEMRRTKGLAKIFQEIFLNLGRMIRIKAVRRILFSPIHTQFGGRLRGFISGGAPLEIETGKFFDVMGIPVYQGYGLTETSPVITVNTWKGNRFGSVGKPLPGVYVRIASEGGEEGEILTKGPHVMKGYYKRSDLTNEVIDEGRWFHTGDLGRFDKDGFLYITGRIKNLIVLPGGKKVHPEEVEAVLSGGSQFKEVCVLAYRTKEGKREGGEAVCAVIVPSDSLKHRLADPVELHKEVQMEVRKLSENLASYKRPVIVRIYPGDLPRTATRKIRRPLIAEWLSNENAIDTNEHAVKNGKMEK